MNTREMILKNKSVILLSGGLDSLMSLAIGKEKYTIDLAITFDYGQKSLKQEIFASKKICKYFKIDHKIIKLDWLKEITNTSLVSEKAIPEVTLANLDSNEFVQKSAEAVWVPNRNGLFLNVAACFADSFGYEYIIFGANKEEGTTFLDNTQDFIDKINASFEFSTLQKPKVIAPLINFDKNDIVKIAIEKSAPLELTRSCYSNKDKNCGVCESCVRLKRALKSNNCENIIEKIF